MKRLLYILVLIVVGVFGDHHADHADHADHHHHHDGHEHSIKTEQDFIKFHDHCVSQLKIPDEQAEHYKSLKYSDDELTHKYMKCIFEQYGFLDSHGHFDDRAMHEQLASKLGHTAVHTHDDETHRLVNNCIEELSKDAKADCSCRAYRVGKCIFKEAPIKWY